MCMWQESSAVSFSLWQDQDLSGPETVLAIPQTQPKGCNTRSVTCHSCPGQRWESHVSLLALTCNNHLTENLYNTTRHAFCFSLPVLAKALRSRFSFHLTEHALRLIFIPQSGGAHQKIKIISVSILHTEQKINVRSPNIFHTSF